jgi:hypothetical protein
MNKLSKRPESLKNENIIIADSIKFLPKAGNSDLTKNSQDYLKQCTGDDQIYIKPISNSIIIEFDIDMV